MYCLFSCEVMQEEEEEEEKEETLGHGKEELKWRK